MHTAEHALKPTVLYGAEELADLMAGSVAPDARPLWGTAIATVLRASAANALHVVAAAVTLGALRLARRRSHGRR
jgi:hypothetical protein